MLRQTKMARVSKTSPFQPRRQTQSRSNTEGDQEKEERESETKAEEDKSTSSSTTSNSDERISAEEKGKGKGPMEVKWGKQRTRDINEIMYGPGKKAKGIVIGEGAKKSETATGKSKRKAPAGAKRGRGRKRAYVGVKSLRSGTDVVNGKEVEDDVGWDAEIEEEVFKGKMKERKSDGDDSDPGGADHTNASALGCA